MAVCPADPLCWELPWWPSPQVSSVEHSSLLVGSQWFTIELSLKRESFPKWEKENNTQQLKISSCILHREGEVISYILSLSPVCPRSDVMWLWADCSLFLRNLSGYCLATFCRALFIWVIAKIKPPGLTLYGEGWLIQDGRKLESECG